jgi:hypothetical protein
MSSIQMIDRTAAEALVRSPFDCSPRLPTLTRTVVPILRSRTNTSRQGSGWENGLCRANLLAQGDLRAG